MKKILIITANYYKDISLGLLNSAKKNLPRNFDIKIIKVPGVFEIPVTISKHLKKFDAFIALGCVIKGQTPHFDFISQSSTNAIMDLAVNSKKPIGNGILTCLNISIFTNCASIHPSNNRSCLYHRKTGLLFRVTS